VIRWNHWPYVFSVQNTGSGQLYYGAVQTLPQVVLSYIRKHELLKAGDRVGAAVSGGADSVAMLGLLLELRREVGIVLSVVHFNHQLRGAESDADEQFVAKLARRHDLELHCESGDVALHSSEKRLSQETAARELRYAYFRSLLTAGCVNRIATAHTLDDQAETVLMRVVRGAGTRGLAGIYPRLVIGKSQSPSGSRLSAADFQENHTQDNLAIVRPLLGIRRMELESYLKATGQDWREDSSNHDLRHTRNRVRHEILPRLERTLNPEAREALAETAEIARAEEEYWEQEVNRRLPDAWRSAERKLRLEILLNLPLALQRRMVRAAAETLGLRLEFRQVAEILEVCRGCVKSAELAAGWNVSRSKNHLMFERAESILTAGRSNYEYRLPVPGVILVPELGARFEARLVPGDRSETCNSDDLLDPAALAKELVLRNRRAGDRYWPAHTKAPKKVKELLQEKHASGPHRQLWPVLVSGTEVVWVRGFPTPAAIRAKDGNPGILIKESAL
jgi:tRNA(Ile)-lysidine synthase